MKKIENQAFGLGTVVQLDGKFFVGCHFNGCCLTYDGGSVEWRDCSFDKPTTLFLGAHASRVVKALRTMGFVITEGEVRLGADARSRIA